MKVEIMFRHFESEPIPTVKQGMACLPLEKFINLLKSGVFGELVTVQFDCQVKTSSGATITNPPIIYTVTANNVDTKKFLGFLNKTKEKKQ